jgi:hypothetical protein
MGRVCATIVVVKKQKLLQIKEECKTNSYKLRKRCINLFQIKENSTTNSYGLRKSVKLIINKLRRRVKQLITN